MVEKTLAPARSCVFLAGFIRPAPPFRTRPRKGQRIADLELTNPASWVTLAQKINVEVSPWRQGNSPCGEKLRG